MKKVFFVFALVALFVTPALADSQEPTAEKLWNIITKEDPYKNWGNWPDHKGIQKGAAPHGPLHEVFVNKTGLSKEGYPKLDGTIIVKENMTEDKKLAAITVMYKVKDYNPEGGNWFWAKFAPDGNVDKSGKVAGCIGCHGSRKDHDYIMVSDF